LNKAGWLSAWLSAVRSTVFVLLRCRFNGGGLAVVSASSSSLLLSLLPERCVQHDDDGKIFQLYASLNDVLFVKE